MSPYYTWIWAWVASIYSYVNFIVCDVAFEYSGDITIPPVSALEYVVKFLVERC